MAIQPTIFQLLAVCEQTLELLKYSANGGLNSYEGKVLKQFKCRLNSNHLGSQFNCLLSVALISFNPVTISLINQWYWASIMN